MLSMTMDTVLPYYVSTFHLNPITLDNLSYPATQLVFRPTIVVIFVTLFFFHIVESQSTLSVFPEVTCHGSLEKTSVSRWTKILL